MNAYLQQVTRILSDAKPPAGVRIAAYDSGFGLSLGPDEGPEALTLALIPSRFAKIPDPPNGPDWDANWDSASKLVKDFVRAHNARVQ